MRLRDTLAQAARTARLMVGVQDYPAYVAQRARSHPGEPVMSRAEFHRACTERRFGGDGRISRCC